MFQRLSSFLRSNAAELRCVGAYHKAGTVWLNGIFQEVATALNLEFSEVDSDTSDEFVPRRSAIVFNHSSRFPACLFKTPVSGIRIVRDPRDMVISGAHYHCRGAETWLNAPQDLFGGKSYCETISAFETDQEKYRFEMRNTASYVIRQMVNSDFNEPLHDFVTKNFSTIRYEKLINDKDLVEVREICKRLQLSFDVTAPIFARNSLFGGKEKNTKHIRSGKTHQWKTEFNRQTAEEFSDLHQEALEVLGYEVDTSWVKQF